MVLFKWFKKRANAVEKEVTDSTNRNYVCLTTDPIHTINDLRVGDWNMEKVQQSLSMGMLRYAKQSEVDQAKQLGIIKD